jgi:hypothetical protein
MKLDHEQCAKILCELIEEQGEVVFSNVHEVGGVDHARAWKFRDLYWLDETGIDAEWSGPFETLLEILEISKQEQAGLIAVGGGVEVRIDSTELTSDQIIEFLWLPEPDPEVPITINGEPWVCDESGRFQRVPRVGS